MEVFSVFIFYIYKEQKAKQIYSLNGKAASNRSQCKLPEASQTNKKLEPIERESRVTVDFPVGSQIKEAEGWKRTYNSMFLRYSK